MKGDWINGMGRAAAVMLLGAAATVQADGVDPLVGAIGETKPLADIRLRFESVDQEPFTEEAAEVLVGVFRDGSPNHFRAVRTPVRWADQDIFLPKEARDLLKVKPGERVSVIPFE